MGKLLHIAFNPRQSPPSIESLKPVYDMALDWLVYAPNCCIVFTSSEPDVWFHRLEPVLNDGDSILIHEIYVAGKSIFTGRLPDFAWAWMQKYASGNRKPLPLPKPDRDGDSK